jgi:hypothetical protein
MRTINPVDGKGKSGVSVERTVYLAPPLVCDFSILHRVTWTDDDSVRHRTRSHPGKLGARLLRLSW